MAGIDGTGSSNGLSYIDQLKAQQEKKTARAARLDHGEASA